MASNYKKEPIFMLERTMDDKTKMPEKYMYQGPAGMAEVHISSGAIQPCGNLPGSDLEQVVLGVRECSCRLIQNYPAQSATPPLPAETTVTAPEQNHEVKLNFYHAIDLIIKKVLGP